MSTATESETCPDVFAIQAAINALLAEEPARREELSADEQGILNYLFGRPSESDRRRNEIARMAAVRDAQRCYAAAPRHLRPRRHGTRRRPPCDTWPPRG